MRNAIFSNLLAATGLLSWACTDPTATAPKSDQVSHPEGLSASSVVAPSATFLAAPDLDAAVLTSTVIEGTAIKLALVNPTPAGGTFTYAFDCGTGSGFGLFGSNNRGACPTVDNGVRTVRGEIRDVSGTVTQYSKLVTIVNQAPHVVLATTQGPTSPLGSPRSVSGTFTDPGLLDAPWAWSIQWGDGGTSSGSTSTQAGAISASHVYMRAGTFRVRMTVTDKDGGAGKSNSVSVQITPGNVAYVALMSSSSVAVVPTATNQVVASLGLPDGAFDVAITPDGRFLYVTTPGPGFQGGPDILSVISTASNTVVATIHLGQTPLYVRISPDGAFAYTGNLSTSMSVISTATNTLLGTIDAGSNRGGCSGGGVALTPDGAFAYMANQCSATVSVISTGGMTEVGFVRVGNVPLGVAMSVDGRFVYVANEQDGTVSVIKTADNSVAQTITVGGNPQGVTASPNGLNVYVANAAGGVAVISTATNQVVGSFSGVGSTPISVALTPDGALAYVTSFNSNTVSVVSTATGSIVASIDVGGTSTGAAIR